MVLQEHRPLTAGVAAVLLSTLSSSDRVARYFWESGHSLREQYSYYIETCSSHSSAPAKPVEGSCQAQ